MADRSTRGTTDQTTDRLYRLPPERFIAERAAAVAAALATGDREAAAHLAALRKPTTAAWLVNIVTAARPDLVEQISDLAGALRDAHRNLCGAELRALTIDRRRLLSTMLAEVRRLATEAGRPPRTPLPLTDVERTLAAALADPEIAAEVRTGRLVRAVGYSGFGDVPRPRLRLISGDGAGGAGPGGTSAGPGGTSGDPGGVPHPASPDAAALRRARVDATAAEAELARLRAAEREAVRARDELAAELADVHARLSAAGEAVERTGRQRRAAEQALAWSRRRLDVASAPRDSVTVTESPGDPRSDGW